MDREKSVIGVVPIDPEKIGDGGEYVVAVPRGARALNVGNIGTDVFVWIVSPVHDDMDDAFEYRIWFVVPGGMPVQLPAMAVYMGTAVVPGSGDDAVVPHDWHLFHYPFPVQAQPDSVKARFQQYH
jgi:hypothetical protein